MDGGSERKGAAIGVAVMVVAVLTLLPFLIAFAFYTFVQIQAIITGLGFSAETLDIPVFLIVLVATVALLILAMAGVAALVGRSFTPRRRRRRKDDPIAEISEA